MFWPQSRGWRIYIYSFAASSKTLDCKNGAFGGPCMGESQTRFDRKFDTAFLIAAYASFFAWLTHSFAVRAFFDSLHLLTKLPVKR